MQVECNDKELRSHQRNICNCREKCHANIDGSEHGWHLSGRHHTVRMPLDFVHSLQQSPLLSNESGLCWRLWAINPVSPQDHACWKSSMWGKAGGDQPCSGLIPGMQDLPLSLDVNPDQQSKVRKLPRHRDQACLPMCAMPCQGFHTLNNR